MPSKWEILAHTLTTSNTKFQSCQPLYLYRKSSCHSFLSEETQRDIHNSNSDMVQQLMKKNMRPNAPLHMQ